MITTCPECLTVFRVTEEQLAVREGRVRCGRCTAVFDARGDLRPDEPEPQGDTTHVALSEPAPEVESANPLWSRAFSDASIDERSESAAAPADSHGASAAVLAPESAAQEPVDPALLLSEPPPKRRIAWVLAGGLLGVSLMVQVAFHYRGEIAVLIPEARPMLTELCSALGCRLPLPRRADLISIESSDLQADPGNPGVMVLTATLRNRAAFAQSHPALELTLTDTQDQPLARRVLGMQDYVGRGVDLEVGFPGNSEVPVKMYMEASSLKATGYRLYLFYP